ncbi:MAG: SAF domain-containing protein [Acidimicrobiales bacterium]
MAALLILASLVALRAEHQAAARLRAEWGPHVAAWTVVTDLESGHVLAESDLVTRLLPPAALPADAVTVAPVGGRLLDSVGEGEIVRAGRVDGVDEASDGSHLGSGRGAVALSSAAPHLEVGDRVDLYGLLDGDLVAAGAVVVDVTDDRVPVVAVDDGDLPAVIRAFTTGDVVPVVTG